MHRTEAFNTPVDQDVRHMGSIRIRTATSLDREGIRSVHLGAFPVGENQLVATLAVNLLSEDSEPETISLVAEVEGAVVGHIAFSPVVAEASTDLLGYILAPLAVKPEYHKAGIGSQLVESGIALLSTTAANVLFVYGDPTYYGRFGFSAQSATRFIPPCGLQYPFGWQARVLHEEGLPRQAVKLSCVPSLCDPALW